MASGCGQLYLECQAVPHSPKKSKVIKQEGPKEGKEQAEQRVVAPKEEGEVSYWQEVSDFAGRCESGVQV